MTEFAREARLCQQHQRKLKMLCLHGYNTNTQVMEYQMRHFRQVFHEVMDFQTLDAPFECREPPPKELMRFMGKNQRFRSWLIFHQPNGNAADCVSGLEQATECLCSFLKTHGPFDGILAFSQGGIVWR